jgi:hypothetical protein
MRTAMIPVTTILKVLRRPNRVNARSPPAAGSGFAVARRYPKGSTSSSLSITPTVAKYWGKS